MLFAAFGGLNGHLNPFRRALFHGEEAGIMTFLQTGDLVVGGPQAAETLALAEEKGVVFVRGKTDWTLARFEKKRRQFEVRLAPEDFAAYEQAAADLAPAELERIAKLPRTRMLSLDKVEVLLCHGTPMSEREILEEDTPLVRFQRCREERPADIIVCGGAAAPFTRWVGETLFVNCGSLSADGESAVYAAINTDDKPWQVRFETVPPDQVA